jgi:hypothetical protein
VARGIKDLDSMVVPIGNDKLANPVNGYSGKTIKFTLAIAVTSEAEPMLAILVEDLDPMVGRVSHHDGVVSSDRNATRPSEEAGLATTGTECQQDALLLHVHARGTVEVGVGIIVLVLIVLVIVSGLFSCAASILVFQVACPRAEVVII